jgi:hypothetical protein
MNLQVSASTKIVDPLTGKEYNLTVMLERNADISEAGEMQALVMEQVNQTARQFESIAEEIPF